MPKHQTNKVKARTNRILKAVQDHENMEDVAKELGITRRALSYNMASYDFQSSLAEFLAKDMADHYATINMLLNSGDSELIIEGMRERGKMHRALVPKLSYKIPEGKSMDSVKADREAYNRLTPEEQQQLGTLLLKLDREDGNKPKPTSVFVESEYKIKSSEENEDDADPRGNI